MVEDVSVMKKKITLFNIENITEIKFKYLTKKWNGSKSNKETKFYLNDFMMKNGTEIKLSF